ncbi:MAG: hypothetical protein A2014_04180 [Spirochaetes bacterium GWF1_49_6]|nr:MAG: hypothetical protein A2014_04180 [Spirochaetes bacterium GWF1_49_6]
MISLNGQKNLSVKVGEIMEYRGQVQESVGYFLSFDISDTSVVNMVSRDTEYAYPERMSAGMTGADEAVQVYRFKALSPGGTDIVFTLDFRGDIESREVVLVQVQP